MAAETQNDTAATGEARQSAAETAQRVNPPQSAEANAVPAEANTQTPEGATGMAGVRMILESGQRMQESGALGRSGGHALLTMYNGTENAADYIQDMVRLYNAGRNGSDASAVKDSGVLNDYQRQAAYLAGQSDAQAAREAQSVSQAAGAGNMAGEETAALEQSERTAPADAEEVQVQEDSPATEAGQIRQPVHRYGAEDAGLVRDGNFRKANLSSREARVMDALGKTLGVKVRFVQDIADERGYKANASYKDGDIMISLNADDPAVTSFVHESVHRIRDASEDAYDTLKAFVQRNMSDEQFGFNEKIRSNYGEGADLTEEIVADGFGRMLESRELAQRFAEEHRSAAQKIADVLRDMLNAVKRLLSGQSRQRLSSEQLDAFSDLEGRLNTMYSIYAEAVQTASESKTAATEDGGTRYALKEFEDGAVISQHDIDNLRGIGRKSVNEFTSEEIRKTEPWARKFYAELGEKSPFFRAWFGEWRMNDTNTVIEPVSVSNRLINNSDIQRGETLNADTQWLISVRSNGIEETAQKNGKWSAEYHSLESIHDMLARSVLLDSETVSAPSKKMGTSAVFVHHFYCPVVSNDSNGIAKLYVVENISGNRKFYLTKIETALSESTGRTKTAPTSSDNTVSVWRIPEIIDFVKKHAEEFRGDSESRYDPKPASKIVNNDGSPRMMYRGDNEIITVFDRRKSKPSNLYGRGFYFTGDKALAQQYGNTRPYYLNAKNPIQKGQHNISREQMRAFLEAVAENEDDFDFWNYGQSATIDSVLSDIYGKGDFEMLQDVSATAIGDLVAAVELFNSINGTEYDGIDLPTETIMFDSEKIKSAYNIGTFDSGNPDIRYSISDKEKLRQYVKKYGAIPKGEKPARDVELPQRTGKLLNFQQRQMQSLPPLGASPKAPTFGEWSHQPSTLHLSRA